MSFLGNLPRAYGRGVKLFAGTFAITGTGAVTVNGVNSVISALCSIINAATTVTTEVAMITSYSVAAATEIATVNLVVCELQAAANVISAAPYNVNVLLAVS